MTIKPDSLDLLETTANSLAESVVPSLNGAERYEVLLAISAIGIVIRELSGAGERSRQDAAGILHLLGSDEAPEQVSLEALESRLADAIRADQFSGESATRALVDYLDQSCRRTLEITNPKVAATYSTAGDE